MSKVTITEIARQLGIATSTVSRALNDSYEVSEETKQKVLELAARLNYSPNIFARNLSMGMQNSKSIAVIIPVITNSFFSEVVSAIEETAARDGFNVLIYLTNYDAAKELLFLKMLLQSSVDGVLMSVSGASQLAGITAEFKRRRVPLVLFDNISEEIHTLKYVTNNYESAYAGTKLLINKGCSNIAFLSFPGIVSVDAQRKDGYLNAMRHSGLEPRVIDCRVEEEANYQLIHSLLSSKNVPDGIFSSMEKIAITAYEVCRNLSLNIPADIKIVSFANMNAAKILDPPLTTITQPASQLGEKACEALFTAIRKERAFEDHIIILPSAIIERKSTL